MDDGLVEDQFSGLLEFVKGLIAVYAAIAALFYLILRLAYFQFYGRLGVLPEEVGIGRTELLSQALAGPAALFLLTTAFGVIIFAITFFISMVFSLAILGLSAIASASGRKVPWTERRQVLAAIEERGMREYIRRLGGWLSPC